MRPGKQERQQRGKEQKMLRIRGKGSPESAWEGEQPDQNGAEREDPRKEAKKDKIKLINKSTREKNRSG